MTWYRRDYFAKSNRGKSWEVFINNLLAGPSKAERKQVEREERVSDLLKRHGLADLNPRKILKLAKDNSISIDQIEKRILLPKIAERNDRSPKKKSIMNTGYQIRIASKRIAAFIGNLISLIIGFSVIAFIIYTLSSFLK